MCSFSSSSTGGLRGLVQVLIRNRTLRGVNVNVIIHMWEITSLEQIFTLNMNYFRFLQRIIHSVVQRNGIYMMMMM